MKSSDNYATKILYRERVRPSVIAQMPLLLLWPSVFVVLIPISTIEIAVSFATLIASLAFPLVFFRAPLVLIERTGNTLVLKVGNAFIETIHVGAIEVIDANRAKAERGPKLSSLAHVAFVSSVPEMLKVEISDPKDPTPYWLFSTREPELIKQLLTLQLP